MINTKYTYSIQNDFPNHKENSDRLTLEIQNSSITISLDCINTSDDECDIWFKDILSSDDLITLNSIVATHSGEPIIIPNEVLISENEIARTRYVNNNYFVIYPQIHTGRTNFHIWDQFEFQGLSPKKALSSADNLRDREYLTKLLKSGGWLNEK